MYIPPGWWHAVLNLESSVAISHTVLHRTRLAAAIRMPTNQTAEGVKSSSDAMNGEGEGDREREGDAVDAVDAVMKSLNLSSNLYHAFDRATGELGGGDDTDEKAKVGRWLAGLRADGICE